MLPEYRKRGGTALLIYEAITRAQTRYASGELSWTQDINDDVNRQALGRSDAGTTLPRDTDGWLPHSSTSNLACDARWFRAGAMAGVQVAGRKQSVPLRPPYKPFKEALRLKVVNWALSGRKELKRAV